MPNPRTTYGDGNKYMFNPGENGSLTAQPLKPKSPQPIFPERKRIAKVIGPKNDQLAMRLIRGENFR